MAANGAFVLALALLHLSIGTMQVSSYNLASGQRSSRATRTRLCMIAEWSGCKIVSNKAEAEGLRLIEISATSELASLYTTPGQYVKIKVGEGKPGFYAIASAPDAAKETLTFLVKDTENNQYISAAKGGDVVDLSAPQGKGFNIVEGFDKYKYDFPTTNLLLMATGSGLAPIAAAIEWGPLSLRKISANSLFERTATLYIGARTEESLPFRSKYSEWETKGVKIIPVLSRASSSWKGRTGYIQDALSTDGVKTPRNSGVLLCGHRGMTDAVKELCLSQGVFEGRLLLNF